MSLTGFRDALDDEVASGNCDIKFLDEWLGEGLQFKHDDFRDDVVTQLRLEKIPTENRSCVCPRPKSNYHISISDIIKGITTQNVKYSGIADYMDEELRYQIEPSEIVSKRKKLAVVARNMKNDQVKMNMKMQMQMQRNNPNIGSCISRSSTATWVSNEFFIGKMTPSGGWRSIGTLDKWKKVELRFQFEESSIMTELDKPSKASSSAGGSGIAKNKGKNERKGKKRYECVKPSKIPQLLDMPGRASSSAGGSGIAKNKVKNEEKRFEFAKPSKIPKLLDMPGRASSSASGSGIAKGKAKEEKKRFESAKPSKIPKLLDMPGRATRSASGSSIAKCKGKNEEKRFECAKPSNIAELPDMPGKASSSAGGSGIAKDKWKNEEKRYECAKPSKIAELPEMPDNVAWQKVKMRSKLQKPKSHRGEARSDECTPAINWLKNVVMNK